MSWLDEADIELNAAEKTLTLTADDEMKMNALWEMVQTRLVRRNVPVKNFEVGKSEASGGGSVKRRGRKLYCAIGSGPELGNLRKLARLRSAESIK